MLEIVVIGEPEFTMGFRLAGIRRVIDVEDVKSVAAAIKDLLKQKEVGIIITSTKVMGALSRDMQDQLYASVSPVTVVVSDRDEMGSLRESIKKAIGVDLWK